MTEQFANAAQSKLSADIDASVTALVVDAATTFSPAPQFRIVVDSEIMLVTGVAGSTFTVQRGAEGSTPAQHAAGSLVTQVVTAGALAALQSGITACFGELSVSENAVAMALATQGQFYLVTQWDTVANANGTTPSVANHNIRIDQSGWWKLIATMCGTGDAGSPTYEFSVFVNGVEHGNARVEQTMNSGTQQSWTISDLNYLQAGDVVDIRVRCLTSANKNITITDGNLTLFRIGT